jgi:hypothetical protein
MDHERQTRSLSGQVTDIFAHRFVVKTEKGKVLADLGPKGAEQVPLREGDRVELIGEMKPSELKVHSIARNDGRPILVEYPGKPTTLRMNWATPTRGPLSKQPRRTASRSLANRGANRSISRFSAGTARATWSSCTSSWTAPCAKPGRCTTTIRNGQGKSKPGDSGETLHLPERPERSS